MSENTPATSESWDPFRELDVFRGWPSMRRLGGLREDGFSAPLRWHPSMDVSENDTSYVVSVELAGAKEDDVQVEIVNSVLATRGEKSNEREEEKQQQRYAERSFGMFSRSFTLPSNANTDDIRASFADGVLMVEIAKPEEPEPKMIQVR